MPTATAVELIVMLDDVLPINICVVEICTFAPTFADVPNVATPNVAAPVTASVFENVTEFVTASVFDNVAAPVTANVFESVAAAVTPSVPVTDNVLNLY